MAVVFTIDTVGEISVGSASTSPRMLVREEEKIEDRKEGESKVRRKG